MTSIVNNLTRSAGRLLLTLGLTAAVTSLASCTKDNGNDLGGNPADAILTVANLPGFSDDAATRAFDPDAPIGTPNIGKTTWAEDDTLAIQIIFYADPAGQNSVGMTCAYAIYKGGAWALGDGLTTIIYSNLPLGVAGGKVVWPIRAKAMQVFAYYVPGQTFDTGGGYCTTRPEDAGKREMWSANTSLITTPGAPIVLDTWEAKCARVRVAAAPGDVVKFAAPDFYPVGGLLGNSLSTPVGTNSKRPGEPVDYLTATADAQGNAYFYGACINPTSVVVSLTHSLLHGDTETRVFQNELRFLPEFYGQSYAINALEGSSMGGTYNWADTYVGPAANLDPAKSKWVITDETPDATTYLGLSKTLTDIATADPTRRVSIELLRAKSVMDYALSAPLTALAEVSAPAATSIGKSAFAGCKGLAAFAAPMATSIGAGAFAYCEKLTTVDLSAATSIGISALFDCKALESIELPAATSIEATAFSGCEKLTTVELPAAVSIGGAAFYGCTALESIELPVITSIGGDAFSGCKTIESIKLTAITSIGASTFSGCEKLTTVELPAAVSIGGDAFYGCEKLTTVELPAATSIGFRAFFGCTSLTAVSAPAATVIENHVFDDCPSLTSLTFGTPITLWGMKMLDHDNDIAGASRITLTLAAGQKAMVWDGNTNTYLPTANNFTDFGTNKVFCGPIDVYNYTFAEIKKVTN